MVWHHSLLLMNSFNKTEAAVFSCRLCFLRAFPFISKIMLYINWLYKGLLWVKHTFEVIQKNHKPNTCIKIWLFKMNPPATSYHILIFQFWNKFKQFEWFFFIIRGGKDMNLPSTLFIMFIWITLLSHSTRITLNKTIKQILFLFFQLGYRTRLQFSSWQCYS